MKRFSIFGSALMVLAVCAVGSLFAEDRIISTDTEINEAVSYGTLKITTTTADGAVKSPAFSSPEAIVLFGGLARAREFLYQDTLDAMNENLLPLWRGKIKLLFSTLSESDAAILGASALAWD